VYFFSIYLFLPAALDPGIHSASNRIEYHKQRNKCFWGVKCGRCVGLATLPPSMSRLSRQCGILNISEPCRTPRPVTGIALLYFTLLYNFTSHEIRILITSSMTMPTKLAYISVIRSVNAGTSFEGLMDLL
jgi:hypothetical protein